MLKASKLLLFCALAAVCVSLKAQTINPNQIRPSTTNGYCLITVSGITQWGLCASGSAFNLTTSGTDGPATYISGTLNIPTYVPAGTGPAIVSNPSGPQTVLNTVTFTGTVNVTGQLQPEAGILTGTGLPVFAGGNISGGAESNCGLIFYTINATSSICIGSRYLSDGSTPNPLASTTIVGGAVPGIAEQVRASVSDYVDPVFSVTNTNASNDIFDCYQTAGGLAAPCVFYAVPTVNGNSVCVNGGSCAPSSAGSTATIDYSNQQTQVDGIASQNVQAFGLMTFGDSITQGTGCTAPAYCYVNLMGAYYGVTPINKGVSGENVQDETHDIFTYANPGDLQNPVVTSMIGINNAYNTASGVPNLSGYQAVHLAGHSWLALSSTNKILATNGSVSHTGTVTTDTTFANANGLTCTAGPCTISYNANIGTTNAFIVWYKEVASGGNFSVTVGGGSVTDTVTGLSTISTSWPTAPVYYSSTVGAAIYKGNWNNGLTANQGLQVTFATGVTIIGFGFPPNVRYKGPYVALGGVTPWQNSNVTYEPDIQIVNGYNIADAKTLYGLGLNVPFVNTNILDPVLDYNAGQNCAASSSPGAHPNNCGHLHLAQMFESVIGGTSPFVGAVPATVTNMVQMNPNPAAIIPSTTALNYGICPWATPGSNYCLTMGYNPGVASSAASKGIELFAQSGGSILLGLTSASNPASQSDIGVHWVFDSAGLHSDLAAVFTNAVTASNALFYGTPSTVPSGEVSVGGSYVSPGSANCPSLTGIGGCWTANFGATTGYIPYYTSAASSGVTLQTNTVNNLSQITLNQINSSTNAAGLSDTVTNTSGGIVQHEIGVSSASTARTALGLGTAATQNTGTSGATLCLLNALCTFSTSSTSAPSVTAQSTGTNNFINPLAVLSPNLLNGQHSCFDVGVAATANNWGSLCFLYSSSGSTSNAYQFYFYGNINPILSVIANGLVSTLNNTLDDGSGNMTVKTLSVTATQTTVNCSTSGTAIFSQPLLGASDKKVLIHLTACLGTASYTYPTAFTNTPSVFASNNVAAGIVTTISTSAVTVTGATTTGALVLEDY